MLDPISPDDLAVGAILRALVREVAALKSPARPDDAFDEFRERVIRQIEGITIPFADERESTTIRAHAQVIVEHLLDRSVE